MRGKLQRGKGAIFSIQQLGMSFRKKLLHDGHKASHETDSIKKASYNNRSCKLKYPYHSQERGVMIRNQQIKNMADTQEGGGGNLHKLSSQHICFGKHIRQRSTTNTISKIYSNVEYNFIDRIIKPQKHCNLYNTIFFKSAQELPLIVKTKIQREIIKFRKQPKSRWIHC